MSEEKKYELPYLYNSYKKHYKKADLDKANKYNDLSIKLHGVDLRDRYHAKLAKKEDKGGLFGLGKTKRLRYG
jgi:hypothetical protein